MTDKSDDNPNWGEAMAALPNDRWRRLVVALYDEDAPRKGKGLFRWAMAQAGFQCKDGKSASALASRLLQDPRLRRAAAEYSKSVLRGRSPVTIQAVRELLANPKSKHAKAVDAVLNRADPLPAPTTNINIDNTVRVDMNGEAMIARVRELAVKHGIDPDALLSGWRTPDVLELEALRGAPKELDK
jgi:hypothetical protein